MRALVGHGDYALYIGAMPATRLLAAVAVGAVVGCVVTSSAEARSKPRISFTFPSSADAGKPISFTWQASKLKTGDRVVVQRQMGTAAKWNTIGAALRASSPTAGAGTATIPALSLGEYNVRIAVLDRKKTVKKPLVFQARKLRVFGNVPLSAVAGGTPNTETTPTGTFTYVRSGYATRDGDTAFTVATNNCRSVHLDFLLAGAFTPRDSAGFTGTVTVVQESRDPIAAGALYGQRGSLDAPLVPGQSWSVRAQTDSYEILNEFLNGSASCFSTASGI